MQDVCDELRQDNAHLKKALAERERGTASQEAVARQHGFGFAAESHSNSSSKLPLLEDSDELLD